MIHARVLSLLIPTEGNSRNPNMGTASALQWESLLHDLCTDGEGGQLRT